MREFPRLVTCVCSFSHSLFLYILDMNAEPRRRTRALLPVPAYMAMSNDCCNDVERSVRCRAWTSCCNVLCGYIGPHGLDSVTVVGLEEFHRLGPREVELVDDEGDVGGVNLYVLDGCGSGSLGL